ncbi:MAG: hypothetical protein ACREFB_09315 [Stellaceae bacterium]
MAEDGFTPEQRARLATIWDRLYELYLQQANGERDGIVVQGEIDTLLAERDAIRPWGWSTGKNWKDDIPPEELAKLLGQK